MALDEGALFSQHTRGIKPRAMCAELGRVRSHEMMFARQRRQRVG